MPECVAVLNDVWLLAFVSLVEFLRRFRIGRVLEPVRIHSSCETCMSLDRSIPGSGWWKCSVFIEWLKTSLCSVQVQKDKITLVFSLCPFGKIFLCVCFPVRLWLCCSQQAAVHSTVSSDCGHSHWRCWSQHGGGMGEASRCSPQCDRHCDHCPLRSMSCHQGKHSQLRRWSSRAGFRDHLNFRRQECQPSFGRSLFPKLSHHERWVKKTQSINYDNRKEIICKTVR